LKDLFAHDSVTVTQGIDAMKFKLLPAISVGILVFALPSQAAKVCSGNATALSYKFTTAGTIKRGQQATFSAPNGCKIICIGGDQRRNIPRLCHWG